MHYENESGHLTRPRRRLLLGSVAVILGAAALLIASAADATLNETYARPTGGFGVFMTGAPGNPTGLITLKKLVGTQYLDAHDFELTDAGDRDPTSSTIGVGTGHLDISSGLEVSTRATVNCVPNCPIPAGCTGAGCLADCDVARSNCGNYPSGWYQYHYESLTGYSWLFMRVRVRGNPRDNADGFSNDNWNFLLSIDNDYFKEFWININGQKDEAWVYFHDGPTNNVPDKSDCDVPGAGCVIVNRFVACNNDTATGCTNSVTRVVDATDGTGTYFVDVMMNMAALTRWVDGTARLSSCPATGACFTWDSSRAGSGQEWYPQAGNQPFAYNPPALPPSEIPTYISFNYTTGASNTDPVHRDFIFTGEISAPTPVTLSYFRAMPATNGSVRLEWSTANEVGNAGFDVVARVGDEWVQVNDTMIASKVIDAIEPVDYALDLLPVAASHFKVIDRGVDGRVREHGPFAFGEEYGQRVAPEKTNWPAIRGESAGKGSVRSAAARSRAREKSRGAAEAMTKGTPPGLAGYPELRLKVSEDGLYRVTYEAMAAAGVDLAGVSSSLLSLTSPSGPVPMYVEAGKRAVLGPGSYLEFYGEAVRSLYTRTNVYRLAVNPRVNENVHVSPAPASKGTPAAWYMATAEVNKDKIWSPISPTEDPWLEDRIIGIRTPVSRSYTIDLDNVVPEAPATLSVGVWGASNPLPTGQDHHLLASLNGQKVADQIFSGVSAVPIAAEVSPSTLREGANTLTLTLPTDTLAPFDIVAVDRYALTYPRAFVAKEGRLSFRAAAQTFRVRGLPSSSVVVYRFTDKKVERLTGFKVSGSGGSYEVTFRGSTETARYVVSTEAALKAPTLSPVPEVSDPTEEPAQYVVVSHPDFLDALEPLVAARRAQGLSAKVVDVTDVYERFSGGVVSPQAIRSFVAQAAASGTEYVLLVGGDTFDYLDNMGLGSVSFVPTFYVRTGSLITYSPSDGVLADVTGDDVADVAIGRLPAKSSGDLAAMLDKTLQYPSGGSVRRAVFIADVPDGADRYSEISELGIASLGDAWQVDRAYADVLGVPGAKNAMKQAINAGVALTSYMGHSDYSYWSPKRLFTVEDVPTLTNAGAPTLVTQWGCWNTFFVHPTIVSMSDRFMAEANKGAAAVIGPSTLTEVESDRLMSELLLAELAKPGATVGKALNAAKAALATRNPQAKDVLLGLNLMGDPALRTE